MTRAPSFAGVILATGESSPTGRDKALIPWQHGTLLSAHIEALKMHTDFVLIVAGANFPALEPIADANGAFLVVNPHPERGQFSSLQVGLQEVLNRGRDAALVTPVNCSPVRPETIARLRQEFEQAVSSVWAMVPEHAGRHGHPVVVGREMITAILQAPPAADVREVQRANQEHMAYVPLEDESIAHEINTPEEYQRIGQE
jgi:CTP:molybdopterin cytidylyltransferase MocA